MSEQTAGLEAADHDHHEMPTEGSALTGVAVSATLHCLTGCAIGEVAGMAIGTALGFSNLGTIVLAVALGLLDDHARHCVAGAKGAKQTELTDELMGSVGRLLKRG